jgi:hypothetical protein
MTFVRRPLIVALVAMTCVLSADSAAVAVDVHDQLIYAYDDSANLPATERRM